MALLVKTGTYTGDGATTQTISGIGFQPKAVIIMGIANTNNDNSAMLKTAEMSTGASGQCLNLEMGLATNGSIDSLTSDGFVVRGTTTGKNISGVTYYYIAFAGSDCVTGTYTGNGSDNRNITGIGFQPKWVICGGVNTAGWPSYEKSDSTGISTDISYNFAGAIGAVNRIQAIISDGFTIGTSLNNNAATFFYLVLTGSNVYTLDYTGNGSDNRDITGVGFNPISVFIRCEDGLPSVMRTAEVGDLTSRFIDAQAPQANRIQSFITDGFQLGTDTYVNANTKLYHAVVFGAAAASGPANLKTYNTNLKANIKTINTNPIANVKTLDTNV